MTIGGMLIVILVLIVAFCGMLAALFYRIDD